MYYHLFDNEIASWMRRNILIKQDSRIPTACVGLDAEEGYSVYVNAEFMDKLSDEGKKAVILHELMHVIRGDCIKIKEVGSPMSWNVASDCHINNTVDIATVEKETGIKSVTYDRIKKKDWPEHIQATQWIYNKLAGDGNEKKNSNDSGQGKADNNDSAQGGSSENKKSSSPGKGNEGENNNQESSPNSSGNNGKDADKYALSNDIKPAEGDLEKCKVRHSKTVMSAPKSFGLNISRPSVPAGIKPIPVQDVKIVRTIKDVLKNVVPRFGTTKVRTRTWARENRSVDFLRGHSRRKLAKVMVCLDVSGSMCNHVQKILGLGEWLKSRMEVINVIWADEAQIIKDMKNLPDVGGGTNINSCLNIIRKNNVDVSVIVTDGEFDKMRSIPKSPIIWVLFGSKCRNNILLKSGDIIIDGE